MKTKNHGILKTLIKIQFHHKTLNLTNINPLTNWQVSFNEIELDNECEPDPQLCDSVSIFESMLTPVFLPNLDQFPQPTFIPISIDLEIESQILDSHIPLIGKECEFQFLDLDSTLEPKLTLVFVPEPIILEFKSIIPPSHILLLDIGIDHDDSMMIFQDWSCKESKFHDRIFQILFILGTVNM